MEHSLKLNIQVLKVLNLLETFIHKHKTVPVQMCIKLKQTKNPDLWPFESEIITDKTFLCVLGGLLLLLLFFFLNLLARQYNKGK